MTPSTAIPQNSQQPSNTTALDETSFNAETTESINLREWQAIRSQQEEKYNASLLADIEKAIEERRQRMAARVEPLDGEFLKAKYPNGDVNKRKFIMSDPIQVLFDFIGQDEMASEVFRIQEATSSNAIESTSTGSISDHGIKPFSTLYILWTSPFDNLEKHCDPVNVAQPPVDSPFVQSSVALSPVQSPVALPSVQPSVALFTAQTPFINFNFEDQPTEPIVIDIDEETPLSSPSPQPSDIVDLSLIDQGRSVALEGETDGVFHWSLPSATSGFPPPPRNRVPPSRWENLSRGQYLPHYTTTADTDRI